MLEDVDASNFRIYCEIMYQDAEFGVNNIFRAIKYVAQQEQS